MLKRHLSLVLLLTLLALVLPTAAQTVMISEFMADNLTSNDRDEDGERNDWLELQNYSSATVNLNGWFLTDNAGDLRQWRFPVTSPAINLAPGARLVVWCSGKNRKAAVDRLHTNFKLDKDGEFLGLVRPDGVTIEHSYGPTYPPQIVNGTYGIEVVTSTTVVIPEGAPGKARVPASLEDYTTAMAGWNSSATFDDSAWQSGNSGFGFGIPSLVGQGGDVSATMLNVNASLCVRFTFDLPSLDGIAGIRLKMKFADGYVAFLNGTRLTSYLAPSPLAWNSALLINSNRSDADASVFFIPSLSGGVSALRQGTNVLAFQLLNNTASDGKVLLRPQFEVDFATSFPTGYLTTPTRGLANSALATAIGPAIDAVTKNPERPVGGAGSAPIIVTARVTPTLRPFAASNPVVLKWRRMFDVETTVVMTFNAATGLWSGAVPTTSLAPGEMIRWRVEARDTAPTYSYGPPYPFPTNPPGNPPPRDMNVDLDQYYGTVAQDGITTSNLPILHWFAFNPANADGLTGESSSFLFQPIPEFPAGTPGYTPPGPKFYDNIPTYRHGQSSAGFPQKSHNLNFNKDNRFSWKDGAPAVRGINLLSTYADKTKVRHALAYDTWAKSGHIASHFAQSVRVQLNGSFRGLYDFVEDGNEDFLQRAGLDPMGSLYKVYNDLRDANPAVNNANGSEKKHPDTTDFTDLQAFVDGIKDSQAMTTRLRYVFDNVDIPSLVNFLAMHTLIMNRDTGHKNYYVFRDTAKTGEWSALPWDQDLSFGHTWTSAQNYFDDDIHSQGPLQVGGGNRLMQIVYGSPELNALFVARVRSLANQFLVSSTEENGPLAQKINELINKIDPNPNNPSSGTDDADLNARQWGFWVDGSGARLDHTDARMSDHTVRAQAARLINFNPIPHYPGANPYPNWGDNPTSMLPFLTGRRDFIFRNPPPQSGAMPIPASEPPNPTLVIESIDFNPAGGTQDQEYFIIRNPNNFAVDISGWKLSGQVDMIFRGGTVIPRQGAQTLQTQNSGYVNQLIVAKRPLSFRQRSVSPKASEYRYVSGPYKGQFSARGGSVALSRPNNLFDPSAGYTQVATASYPAAPTLSQQHLRITELHYAPAGPTAAENAELPGVTASDFEFIEIRNVGATTLNLQGAKFDRGVEFTFPNAPVSTINPGERRLIVSNWTAYRVRYGMEYDALVLGEWLGNLNNAGEELQLLDPVGEVVLEFTYSNTWHPSTLGQGRTLEARTTDHTLFGQAASWQASLSHGGSPGYEDIPVEITLQPVGKTVNPGQPIVLTVEATGFPAPTYQWRKGGGIIGGATGPTFTIPIADEENEGDYDVLVTNASSAVPSISVDVFVNDPVMITDHPTGKTVNPGQLVELSVSASGTAPLSYQWRKGGEPILNATASTYTITAATEDDEGSYDVVVSNIVGPQPSNAAVVSVNDPVQLVLSSGDQTVNPGADVTFSVAASGTGPFTYQWRKDGDNLDGETNASLVILGVTSDHVGAYDVVVTGAVGPATSGTVQLNLNQGVSIVGDPKPLAVELGGKAAFTVVVVGTEPFTYQWRKDGQDIEGATEAIYSIASTTDGHLGNYDVVVSNVVDSATSAQAKLSIVDWPANAGNYQGVLAGPNLSDPADHPRPGRVTLKVAKTGKFTGSLEYLGVRHGFKGEFDASLEATVIVDPKSFQPVTLHVWLDGVEHAVEVEAQKSTRTSEALLAKIPERSKSTPALKMGRYTVLLEPGAGAPDNLTASGYLTINVSKTGVAKWAGKLPDTGVLRGSAWLTADDQLAFYVPLYAKKEPFAGHVAGPLAIGGTNITGAFGWRKPPQSTGSYWPGGFEALLAAEGGLHIKPAKNVRTINVPTLALAISGPLPGGSLSAPVQLSEKNKFLVQGLNAEKVKLNYNPTTGLMKGSFFDSTLRKTRKLEGVLLQGEERAAGFFLGAERSGDWHLAAPAADE